MTYLYASFRASNIVENAWFTQGQRDNCTYPFWLLRERFGERGVLLNTPDVNAGRDIAFELQIDVQDREESVPTYLLLWETMQVQSRNKLVGNSCRYRRIFSWNDSLVENCNYVKFHLPIVNDTVPFSIGWTGRDKLCCAVAGNKHIKMDDMRDLYSKRVETFRWFEQNAPDDFDLFGTGWERTAARSGLLGKLESSMLAKFYAWTNVRPFPCYRGTIARKRDTLERYRFSICYENISDLPGYITEKIFDCFFAGCIPVYWGASNICDYVPQTCFVDRRKFSDHESLHHFLTSMAEADYIAYQIAIREFLTSQSAIRFYAEAFASHIVETVMTDFEQPS